MSKKLLKASVEKLRLLLGKALEAGPRALRPTSELRVFLYVCEELTDRGGTEAHAGPRAPAKNDGKSAHPDCIGVLLLLASERPQLLARLSPLRRKLLLNQCIEWICGEPPGADGAGGGGGDGADSRADGIGGAGASSSRAPAGGGGGIDPSVVATPQLLVHYAQLLSQLPLMTSDDLWIASLIRCTMPSCSLNSWGHGGAIWGSSSALAVGWRRATTARSPCSPAS